MSFRFPWLFVVGASLQVLFAAGPTNGPATPVPPPPRKSAPTNVGTFKFPDRGAPKIRVNGGSRSAGHLPKLYVLAPDQTGFTTNGQPTLYWYQSEQADLPLEFTVTQPRAIDPLVRITLDPPQTAGFHQFELASCNAKLALNTDYRWSVALIVNPKSRSKDVVATGGIKRIRLPETPAKPVPSTAEPEAVTAFLANNGLWYDAIEIVSRSIQSNPENTRFKRLRAELLQQVGLPEPAAHDRGAGEPANP